MSGFKTWNNSNNTSSLFIVGNGGGNIVGNNTTNTVFQWSETNTGGINNVGVLSTDKDVHTDGVMKCVSLQQTSDIRLKNNIAPLNKKVNS